MKTNKTIIITESQEQAILNYLKQEETPQTKKGKPYVVNPDKVLLIKRFLDTNFQKNTEDCIGFNSLPYKSTIINVMSTDGSILRKNIRIEELNDIVIDKFKNMFLDKEERRLFINQVITDWLNDKIGIFGTLSVNSLKR